ncbi:MAG TPA: sigma 54-interacting transcriptional regulator [Kofleriaceae bacterium]
MRNKRPTVEDQELVQSTIDDNSMVTGDTGAARPVVVLATSPNLDKLVVFPGDSEVAVGRRIEGSGRVAEIDDERVSREHATVRFDRDAWLIRDRDSRNGTYVDGARISGETRRRGNAVMRVGHTVLLLIRDGRGYDPLPEDRDDHVIGPELARVYDEIRRHASDSTLLVHGESGSGKELIARLYHASGPRSDGPFVAVNCAAIPEGVAERLLFGSRAGAFSGARDAVGFLQSADGGTLFLDEIAELDLAVQAKLLRALELREVTPIGATAPTSIDIGVIAASHQSLRAQVALRKFRDDLFYRLSRTTVRLPPLRERKLDIVRLVLRELATIDRDLVAHGRLIEACCIRPWPGNVRELLDAVRRAASVARAAGRKVVRHEDLPAEAGLPIAEEPAADQASPSGIDKHAVVEALARAGNVVSVAARTLGIHRTQLYRLMDKFGIARDS